MKVDLSFINSLSLHDVLNIVSVLYVVAVTLLTVLPLSGPLALTPDIHSALQASLVAVALLFTQLHKLGYDVPVLPTNDTNVTAPTQPNPKV